jgi:hypothetical protein
VFSNPIATPITLTGDTFYVHLLTEYFFCCVSYSVIADS